MFTVPWWGILHVYMYKLLVTPSFLLLEEGRADWASQSYSNSKTKFLSVIGKVVSHYRCADSVEMGVAKSEDVVEGEADSESGDRERHEKSNSKRQSSTQTTYSDTNEGILREGAKRGDEMLGKELKGSKKRRAQKAKQSNQPA